MILRCDEKEELELMEYTDIKNLTDFMYTNDLECFYYKLFGEDNYLL